MGGAGAEVVAVVGAVLEGEVPAGFAVIGALVVAEAVGSVALASGLVGE